MPATQLVDLILILFSLVLMEITKIVVSVELLMMRMFGIQVENIVYILISFIVGMVQFLKTILLNLSFMIYCGFQVA